MTYILDGWLFFLVVSGDWFVILGDEYTGWLVMRVSVLTCYFVGQAVLPEYLCRLAPCTLQNVNNAGYAGLNYILAGYLFCLAGCADWLALLTEYLCCLAGCLCWLVS
jgi:hypothetical protein